MTGKPDVYLAGGIRACGTVQATRVRSAARCASTRLPDPTTDLDAVTGAYPLDIDGDGVTDLAVLRHGENVLLRGLGDCRFERANEAWGFDGGNEWTTAFSGDLGGGLDAGRPLAIGNYHDEDFTDPDELCQPNQFVRPAVAGGGFGPPIDARTIVVVPALDALQRLGSRRTARPARLQRPSLLQRPVRRRGAALENN